MGDSSQQREQKPRKAFHSPRDPIVFTWKEEKRGTRQSNGNEGHMEKRRTFKYSKEKLGIAARHHGLEISKQKTLKNDR